MVNIGSQYKTSLRKARYEYDKRETNTIVAYRRTRTYGQYIVLVAYRRTRTYWQYIALVAYRRTRTYGQYIALVAYRRTRTYGQYIVLVAYRRTRTYGQYIAHERLMFSILQSTMCLYNVQSEINPDTVDRKTTPEDVCGLSN